VVTHEGEIDVGMDENKAVVRQYLTAIHAAPPGLTVFDELLAPDYRGDRAEQKAFCSALHGAIREQIFDIVDLVAEGDLVVARFNYRVTAERQRHSAPEALAGAATSVEFIA
jgi:hypothetical protein